MTARWWEIAAEKNLDDDAVREWLARERDDFMARFKRRTLAGRVVRWAQALECDGPSWGTVVVVRQLATHGEVVHRSPFRGNPRAAERAALEASR